MSRKERRLGKKSIANWNRDERRGKKRTDKCKRGKVEKERRQRIAKEMRGK